MDFKTIILLVAAGQGLILSLALISQFRKANKGNVFFGVMVFVASIELLYDFAVQINYHSASAFPFWYLGSYLLWPPALWMFVRLNLCSNFQYKRIHLLLFFPALIEVFGEFLKTVLSQYYGIFIDLNPSWFILGEILSLTWMVVVVILYGYYLAIARKKAIEAVTPVVIKHIHKHYLLFSVFVALTVLWMVLTLSDLQVITWFNYFQVFSLVEILLVGSIFVLGYVAYLNPTFFDIPKAFHQIEDRKSFSEFNDNQEINRLNELLQTGKLFTKNKLSLHELSKELRLPSRYVSYLINTYHQTNFHDYINSFRVKEVINKINDPREQHKTLLALALEAGFNSKSTFNQVFKSHTGKTPSSYLSGKQV